jgi:hypothetical protein
VIDVMQAVAESNRFESRNARPPPLDNDATPQMPGQTVT